MSCECLTGYSNVTSEFTAIIKAQAYELTIIFINSCCRVKFPVLYLTFKMFYVYTQMGTMIGRNLVMEKACPYSCWCLTEATC